jgi:hypothetical protein
MLEKEEKEGRKNTKNQVEGLGCTRDKGIFHGMKHY